MIFKVISNPNNFMTTLPFIEKEYMYHHLYFLKFSLIYRIYLWIIAQLINISLLILNPAHHFQYLDPFQILTILLNFMHAG